MSRSLSFPSCRHLVFWINSWFLFFFHFLPFSLLHSFLFRFLYWFPSSNWSLIDQSMTSRKLVVAWAVLTSGMIMATHCLSLPCNRSSSTPAGAMVGTILQCTLQEICRSSATFALGISMIPPLVYGYSGGETRGVRSATKALCHSAQTDSLYVRCLGKVVYESRLDDILQRLEENAFLDWPKSLTR